MSDIDELTNDPDVDQVIGYPDKTMVVLDAETYLRLKAEIAGLKAALKFYAEPRRYYGPNQKELIDGDPFQPANFPYLWDITRDDGEIARAALLKVVE